MFIKWPKILKSYVKSTDASKNIEVPKNFMAFSRTLVIALTIHVRTMSICFCPVQINYFPLIKGYSQHYKICILLKMEPRREIKLSGSNEYLCFVTNNSTT